MLLKEKDVEFIEYNTDGDKDVMGCYGRASQRSISVPQILLMTNLLVAVMTCKES